MKKWFILSISSLVLLSACSKEVVQNEAQAEGAVEVASTEWVDDQVKTVDEKATSVNAKADELQREVNALLAATDKTLFKDVAKDHWSYIHIKSLYEKNIIKGFDDQTFRPALSISRYQAASMLIKTFNLPLSNSPSVFKDVSNDDPRRAEIMTAYEAGFFKGSDGYFKPVNSMQRHHMALVLQRAFELTDNGTTYTPFSDVSPTMEAYEAIKVIAQRGIAKGSDGKFNPYTPTNREQFAAFIDRALPYK